MLGLRMLFWTIGSSVCSVTRIRRLWMTMTKQSSGCPPHPLAIVPKQLTSVAHAKVCVEMMMMTMMTLHDDDCIDVKDASIA